MTTRRLKQIREIALALAAFGAIQTMGLASAPSGCDDIQRDKHPRIQPRSTVVIVVPSNLPAAYQTGLTAAMNALKGAVDGIQFAQSSTEPEDLASITLTFGGAHIKNMGVYSGSGGSNGYLRTGNMHIYPDTRGCGSTASSLCLDPSNPAAYQAAIQWVFMHELLHALGADHSQKANVMNEFFYGVNNTGNSDPNLGCVTQRVNALLAPYTPPPPPNTCN